jgi:hypothetical protein
MLLFRYCMIPSMLIPNVEALEVAPLDQHGDGPTHDFFNDDQFPLQHDVVRLVFMHFILIAKKCRSNK